MMAHSAAARVRPALLFVAAWLVASSGCSLFERNESPTTPTTTAGPPSTGTPVRYTAIGASDTNGVGSTVVCAPFENCPSGTGYVQVLARRLRESREVTLSNLGLLGTVLSPTIQDIAREYGRNVVANFVDGQAPFVPRDTNLVTIFGGANDVDRLTEAIERGAGASNIRDYADTQIRAFGTDYDRLIRAIRDRAPAAFIIVMNLPNMAALPYGSGYGDSRRRIMQHLSVGFSREANRQAGQGIVVMDLMCDAQVYSPSIFSSDGFHPNDTGYAYLADRLLPLVSGQSSTPNSSCSQMAVVGGL